MSYVTVLEAQQRCNKLVSLNADGAVTKDHGAGAQYIATTRHVPDLDTFAEVIEFVAGSTNRCLAQGYFEGTEDGEPFQVLPQAAISRVTGKKYVEGPVVVGGIKSFARLKSAMKPSCWIQLDRDAAPGTPAKILELDDDAWLAMIGEVCPGLLQAPMIRVPSTSSRVLLDGKPIDPNGCRYWVQIKDPTDYAAFGQRLKLAAFASGMGFDKKIKGGSVPWTVFDPTVFSWERLVFDGKPSVGRKHTGRLEVAEGFELELIDGEPLDTHRCKAPEGGSVEFGMGRRITINGDSATVDGYLTRNTKLELKDHGRMTIEAYFFSSLDQERCQSPFRESKSWNAFVARDDGMMPRVYDNGERQWYVLSDDDREILTMKRATALNFDKLGSESKALLLDPTHVSVAKYAASLLAGRFVYAAGMGWLVWDGLRWDRDVTERFVVALSRACADSPIPTTQSTYFIFGVERLLRGLLSMRAEELDADSFVLNTPDGLLDLRTGESRACQPGDRVSYITEAGVGGSWRGGRFETFLEEICDGDKDLMRYLQVSLGACLSGAVEEHWLLFWTGTGRNGKNTLGDLVMRLMGDYATSLPASALMATKYAAHPTELMELRGRRLVVSSELSEGESWNEARLNSVTGDAVIKAHYMKQDFVEFPRTHKHLIYANREPSLRDVTPGLEARLKIVPFNVSFIGREDPDLGATLREEQDGVLRWLVEGHMAWLENGKKLATCEAVTEASKNYASEQDIILAWTEECCHMDPKARGQAAVLYKNFENWCIDQGREKISRITWGSRMKRYFSSVKSSGVINYVGVCIPGPAKDNVLKMKEKIGFKDNFRED